MVYLLERKAPWAMVNLITAFTIIRRRNGCPVSDKNRKEEMQENANYIAWWMLSTF